MIDDATDASSSENTEVAEESPLDPREQMRRALAEKNKRSNAGQAHLDGHAKAGGEHAKAGGTRQFRRKSGG